MRAGHLHMRTLSEHYGGAPAKYAGLQFDGKSIREHAVAAANPPGRVVGMNRDIDRSSFQRGWRRALVHELGHLAGIGHPILADPLYGLEKRVTYTQLTPRGRPEGNLKDRVLLWRHALHAHRLTFRHPRSGDRMVFAADPPADIAAVIDILRRVRDAV